jgi:hypothetical protein
MDRLRLSNKNINDNSVLFLAGVYKSDFQKFDDMIQDKILSENPISQNIISYDKIPTLFTTLNNWPKSTNILCWRCNRSFKKRPWFEPQSIEPISDNTTGNVGKMLNEIDLKKSINIKGVCITTLGVFCSCNCVQAYINIYSRDIIDKINKTEMLRFVYEIFTGKKIPDIQPSPSPMIMIHFGGDKTEQEYQQIIESLDMAYIRELEDNNFAAICQVYARKLKIEV